MQNEKATGSGGADIDGVPIDEAKLKTTASASALSVVDLDGIPLPPTTNPPKSGLLHEDYDGEPIAADIDGVPGTYGVLILYKYVQYSVLVHYTLRI